MLQNLIFTLDSVNTGDQLCDGLNPVLRIVGIVVFGVKVVVPIILIVIGMFDLARAVTEKDENKIKDAQKLLIKRAIAAVLVFLVVTVVTVLMGLIGSKSYEKCMDCIKNPWSSSCKNTEAGWAD